MDVADVNAECEQGVAGDYGNRDDHALCYIISSHHCNIASPEDYVLAPYHNILCMQVNSSSQIFSLHTLAFDS